MVGDAMAGEGVRRWHATIWSTVCPQDFNAVADALEWCVAKQGIWHIYHYLDDFIVLGSPGMAECGASPSILQRVCQELGVPLALEKQDGPAAVLTFLGIEIDTIRQEL